MIRRVLLCLLLSTLTGCTTPLHRAAIHGDAAAAARYLDAGQDINKYAGTKTALYAAAEAGKMETVKLLVERGADLNKTDTRWTKRPLDIAIEKGHLDVAHFLIESGTDLNGPKGRAKALFKAVYYDHINLVRLLLDRGVSVSARDGIGAPILLNLVAAPKPGHIAIAKLLVERGADVNATKPNGVTPLISAAYYGNTALVRFLLDNGADLDARDSDGTPADNARKKGHQSIVSMIEAERLRRGGASPATASRTATFDEAKMREIIASAVKSARAESKPEKRDTAPRIAPRYRLPQQPDDFAVVVGIEEYLELPKAQFASRDAKAVVSHMEALGIPRRNIIHLSGAKASYTGLKKYLEAWLPKNVKPTSRVYFYFSGHGAPDVADGTAYLVPYDGDPNFLKTTAYPVKRLYKKLAALRAKEVIVVLDACFSGAGGRSVLAEGARPLVTKVDLGRSKDRKVTIFTAASSKEITTTLKDKGHGMFTYFFLKGLNGAAKDAEGRITAKSLYRYLKPLVQDEARRQNREQTPTISYKTNVVLRGD